MKKQCDVCGAYRHQSTMLYSNSYDRWFCCNECLEQYHRTTQRIWADVVTNNPNMR